MKYLLKVAEHLQSLRRQRDILQFEADSCWRILKDRRSLGDLSIASSIVRLANERDAALQALTALNTVLTP